MLLFPVLNQLAAEALTAIGPDVVHTLMAEVLVADSVQYRLRLLGIVEEIGEMHDPGDHLELFNLARGVLGPHRHDGRSHPACADRSPGLRGRRQMPRGH